MPDNEKYTITNAVVTGKSGAGKQPRIDVLVKEFGLEQLSTGNMFRHYLGLFDSMGYPHSLEKFWSWEEEDFVPDEEIRKILIDYLDETATVKSEEEIDELVLGLKAKYFVEKGLFGPDGLVNALLESEFAKKGFQKVVLDGYPRTINQAKYLLELMKKTGTTIDFVLVVDNDDELIIKRTVGRRICPKCGKVYHIEYNPPSPDGRCKECGTPVIQRSDDTEEKIKRRLEEFQTKAQPAVDYLEKSGIPVVHVPGNLEVFTEENVRRSVLDALEDAGIISRLE